MNTSRRRFVTSALGFTALTALGSGCADSEATDDEGPDLDDDATCTAEDTGPSKSFEPDQPRAACDPTPANIEGPYYRAGAPEREDIAPDTEGTTLEVSGRVFDTDCTPLADATVDIWQCDPDGRYDNDGSMPGLPDDVYLLRGKVKTDADGNYSFRTVVPGRYLNGGNFRPRHIHVKVSAPGLSVLTTQLYFDDDECNALDPWVREELMLVLEDDGDDKRASFDFYLPS